MAAWERHGDLPRIPLDEEPLLYARRLVAEKCLYGVDRNPVALDLAKLSLWLVTLAKDHDFAFVNHALKWGDSLVGLSKKQIEAFTWGEVKEVEGFGLFAALPDKRVETAAVLRQQIQAWGDDAGYAKKEAVLREASDGLLPLKVRGDLIIAAFFAGSKDAERLRELARLRRVAEDIADGKVRLLDGLDVARGLLEAERPVVPFHWELEFPEVFERGNPGFDGFVGNPPFLGGGRVSGTNGRPYVDWLCNTIEQFSGSADLVAAFFRRAYLLLRRRGCQGLIATNSVNQGETRKVALEWLLVNGGARILSARKRVCWPGQASVVVSIVHVGKCRDAEVLAKLDNAHVTRITAFLASAGPDSDPAQLSANKGRCSKGVDLGGLGFLFDDAEPSSSPTAVMTGLLTSGTPNKWIRPYLGGEDISDFAVQGLASKFVIDLNALEDPTACGSPELVALLWNKVGVPRQSGRLKDMNWWRFERPRSDFLRGTIGDGFLFALARVSNTFGVVRVPDTIVLNEKVVIFKVATFSAFAGIQGRCHEVWARFFSGTLKDDLQYTPSDCFETYPFPPNWQTNPDLESIGQTYYTYRADLMVRNNQGLTTTYNRFHNPDETDPAILHLRELHTQMDRAVLQAYGWGDIPTECGFFHVHEGIAWEERDAENPEHRARNFRYAWPAAVRDEVLARLLALNAVRAAEEAKAVGGGVGKRGKK